jgi:hypothetical protein
LDSACLAATRVPASHRASRNLVIPYVDPCFTTFLFLSACTAHSLFCLCSLLVFQKSERERAERERRRKLEETAAADCLFCGEFMINSVTEAFVSPDERDEINSWSV